MQVHRLSCYAAAKKSVSSTMTESGNETFVLRANWVDAVINES